MLTVAVAHSPWIGGKVKSVDAAAALAIDGVAKVETIPTGVAVYAKNTYCAFKGRDALEIDWGLSEAETRSAEEQMEEVAAAAVTGEGVVAETYGDLDAAFAGAAEVIEAEYRLPYLAHAPLEVMDGVIENRGDAAEIWMGSQMQTVDQQVTANILGIAPEQWRSIRCWQAAALAAAPSMTRSSRRSWPRWPRLAARAPSNWSGAARTTSRAPITARRPSTASALRWMRAAASSAGRTPLPPKASWAAPPSKW